MGALVYELVPVVGEFKREIGAAAGELDSLNNSANKADGKVDRFGKTSKTAGAEAAKMAKGVGLAAAAAAAAGAAFLTAGQRAADLVNDLNDMSTRTGVSAETLSGLQLAARSSGQELSDLNTALLGFPKRLADTAAGTGSAKDAFEALGISVVDSSGHLRSAEVVLEETVATLQAIEDPTTKAALATQLWGKSGTALVQAVGGKELGEFVALASMFGVDVGPGASKAAADWQVSAALLKTTMDRMATAMLLIVDFPAVLVNTSVAAVYLTGVLSGLVDNLGRLARGDFFDLDFVDRAEADAKGVFEVWKRIFSSEKVTLPDLEVPDITFTGAGGDPVVQQLRNREKVGNEAAEAQAEAQAEIEAQSTANLIANSDQRAQVTRNEYDARIEDARRAAQIERQLNTELVQNWVAAAGAVQGLTNQLTDTIIGNLDTQTEEGKKAARTWFAIQKATGIATATVQGAVSIAQAAGSAPPPYNIPAIIAATALAAFNVAAVAAVQPPSFPQGGVIRGISPTSQGDHGPILVSNDESVLNKGATAAIGQAGVDALNSGRGLGGGELVLKLRHKVIDRQIVRSARTGNLRDQINRRRRVGHSRGS